MTEKGGERALPRIGWPSSPAQEVDAVNPLEEVLSEWLPQCDFAVLSHGFAQHGRDYDILVQDAIGPQAGTHRLTFTHVVAVNYETAVRDDVWPSSWDDIFLDWDQAKDLNGYVWGTNWSNAFPGVSSLLNDPEAANWTVRLGRQMHAVRLETDRFRLRLIFHSLRTEVVSRDIGTIDQVIFPMG